MKKLLFFGAAIAALLIGMTASGQDYNRTYSPKYKYTAALGILHTSWNQTYIVYRATDEIDAPDYRDRYAYEICQLDDNGNVLNTKHISEVGMSTEVSMAEGNDSSVVITSRCILDIWNLGIGVTKFDANLKPVWNKYVQNVFPGGYCSTGSQVSRVMENGIESFIITYIITGTIPNYAIDAAPAALKLQSDNGATIWNRIYTDPVRSGNPNYSDRYNVTTAAADQSCSGGNQNTSKVVLAGYTEDNGPYGEGGLFAMSIDLDGNIIDPAHIYQTAVNVNRSFSPEIIFDNSICGFAMTYMEIGNRPVIPVPSLIGLLQLDNSLNPVSGAYYYRPNENYGLHISQYNGDNTYRISSYISDCESCPHAPLNLLYVDKTSLLPVNLFRYNVNTNGNIGDHVTDVYGNNYLEGIVNNNGIRVIKTLPSGRACGSENFSINHVVFAPGYTLRYRFPEDIYEAKDLQNGTVNASLPYTDCRDYDPAYYKAKGIDGVTASMVNVYPTILTEGADLNVSIPQSDADINIVITNIIGQSTFDKTYAGTNERIMKIGCSNFSDGLNYVTIKTNGSATTFKVLVTK